MSMTRKDFRAFAEEIADLNLTTAERREVAAAVARVCKRSNHQFNRSLFMRACGLEEEQ